MSVLEPVEGELFSVRVIQRAAGVNAQRWGNMWEFQAGSAVDLAGLRELGFAAGDFHQNLLYDLFTVERVVVSTWVPDSSPYDPDEFVTLSVETPGLADSSDKVMMPLNDCIHLSRQVSTGRLGIILMRGGLATDALISPGGLAQIGDLPGLQTAVDSSFADTLGKYTALGTLTDVGHVVMVGGTGPTPGPIRDIVSLNAVGLTNKKLNNKFFNRTP